MIGDCSSSLFHHQNGRGWKGGDNDVLLIAATLLRRALLQAKLSHIISFFVLRRWRIPVNLDGPNILVLARGGGICLPPSCCGRVVAKKRSSETSRGRVMVKGRHRQGG